MTVDQVVVSECVCGWVDGCVCECESMRGADLTLRHCVHLHGTYRGCDCRSSPCGVVEQ